MKAQEGKLMNHDIIGSITYMLEDNCVVAIKCPRSKKRPTQEMMRVDKEGTSNPAILLTNTLSQTLTVTIASDPDGVTNHPGAGNPPTISVPAQSVSYLRIKPQIGGGTDDPPPNNHKKWVIGSVTHDNPCPHILNDHTEIVVEC